MSQHTYLLFPALLAVCVGVWYQQVTVVSEPYLDEYFHIRQAKVYCAGNFTQWDPKITTPPGLYLLSYLLHLAGQGCDISTLRQTNASGIFFTWVPLFLLLKQHYKQQQSYVHAAHTAMNICLFPPLFFFSALYYTDVVSTEVVAWSLYIRGNQTLRSMPIIRGLILVFAGAVNLLFRQTNVFWVAIFNAGIDMLEVLRSALEQLPKRSSIRADVRERTSQLYDLTVEDAYFEDYVLTISDIIVTLVANPTYLYAIITTILPQITILGLFVGFVIWNGGVVLGDKSNHVATIHMPQMLYLWPYIMFFSLPIVLYVTSKRLSTLLAFPWPPVLSKSDRKSTTSAPQLAMPTTQTFSTYVATRALLFFAFTALALLAVHYNTIVHPFTLADNRHYVFYVFKILRMHWSLKYLAAPVYVLCAWIVLGAMGGMASRTSARTAKSPANQGPSTVVGVKSEGISQGSAFLNTATTTRTSFVLIWLATTTLSLVTAPLVEPRYYIIPWLVWRLQVLPPSLVQDSAGRSSSLVLWLETAWLLLINAVTGYIFLYRGFEWPQEAGVVQRFLW